MNERKIPFGKPILGQEERDAIQKVLAGDILVHGPHAHEFEHAFEAYTKSPHAVSVSSCTAALHLAYFYLGLGKGDEVIVPAQTHVATAHAVELTGATPIFVDAEPRTGNIDPDQIEAALSPRTRAISLVHYLGMPAQMDRIVSIAKSRDLFVVEDCALALGTYFDGVHAGVVGDVGCFSFYPVKHITTAEGGMLTTRHKEVAAKITRQKAFGVDKTVAERTVPGVYDVTMLGFNYRMNEIEAVMGIHQLKRLDGFLAKRKENYDVLYAGLSEIGEVRLFDRDGGKKRSSHYCLSLLLPGELKKQRLELVNYLRGHGVGTSVYYPKAVPHFTYYRDKYGFSPTSFPVAADISDSSIALPVGPHLNQEDMLYIVATVKSGIASLKGGK